MTESSIEEKRVFKPLSRILTDGIIFSSIFIFGAGLLAALDMLMVTFVVLIWNGLLAVIWFLIVRPFFCVHLYKDRVVGRSSSFSLLSLPFSDVDHFKTKDHPKRARLFGYYDIHAKDGKKVRLWRRLIGRRQIYKIMLALDESVPAHLKQVKEDEFMRGYGYHFR